MSVAAGRTLQLLQRRNFHHWNQISRVSSRVGSIGVQSGPIHVPARNFGHGKSKIFEHWARHGWGEAGNVKSGARSGKMDGKFGKHMHGKYRGGMYGRGPCNYNFMRMCRRHKHGYSRRWRGGIWGGISFGSALSIVISYNNYQSIIWAMIHGFLSWIYVIYYALSEYNSQEKSANELLEAQVQEISIEIEKLNKIYQKLMKEVEGDDDDNQLKNNALSDQSGIPVTPKDNTYNGHRLKRHGNQVDSEIEQNQEMLDQLKERVDKLENEVDNKE